MDEKSRLTSGKDGISNAARRVLKYARLKTNSSACAAAGEPLPPGTICATGVSVGKSSSLYTGTCLGDSGGPELAAGNVQVAVTSFGPSVGCGLASWGAYTSVADYLASFIQPAIVKYSGGGGGTPPTLSSPPPPTFPPFSPPVQVPTRPPTPFPSPSPEVDDHGNNGNGNSNGNGNGNGGGVIVGGAKVSPPPPPKAIVDDSNKNKSPPKWGDDTPKNGNKKTGAPPIVRRQLLGRRVL